MAAEHLSTFLRSAIAKDPFCHGGVITPEDVIRLETKYPTLFDKPALVAPEQKDFLPEEKKMETVELEPRRITKTPATQKKTGQGVQPKTVKTVQTTMRQPVQPSKFHRDCVKANVPVQRKLPSRIPVKPAAKNNVDRMLTRPAQSFSMEDLKATLKQVLEGETIERRRHQEKDWSPYQENLLRKFGLEKKLIENRNSMTAASTKPVAKGRDEGLKSRCSSVSSYQDYIRPSFGRKRTKVRNPHPSVGVVQRVKSAPGFIRGFSELPSMKNYESKQRLLHKALKIFREGGDKKSQISLDKPEQRDDKSTVLSDIEVYSEISSTESKDSQTVKRKPLSAVSEKTESESSPVKIQTISKQQGLGMAGSQIRLRSQKSLDDQQETAQALFMRENGFDDSSFPDLLKAKSEKARYETKRFLRLQKEASGSKQNSKKHFQSYDLKRVKNSLNLMVSDGDSSDSEKLKRYVEGLNHKSKEETSRVLHKIAKELVYMEVLHQITEMKREQEEAEKIGKSPEKLTILSSASSPNGKVEKFSQVDLPSFHATSTSEPEETNVSDRQAKATRKGGESVKSVEISLKTPDLTPASVTKGRRGSSVKSSSNSNKSARNISLHTPQLTHSSQRIIQAIKERRELERRQQDALSHPAKNAHQDTDCSEMSDFAFSEPSKKSTSPEKPNISRKDSESIRLQTPQLSLPEERCETKDPESVNGPPNDCSTLSGVSSTLLKTPSSTVKSEHEGVKENEKDEEKSEVKNVSNYGSDFTPERSVDHSSSKQAPMITKPSKPTVQGPLTKQTNLLPPVSLPDRFKASIADDEDSKINTSSETAIDFMSEGEFIGQPSYRSPGELSSRQRPQSRLRVPPGPTQTRRVIYPSTYQQPQHHLSFTPSEPDDDDDVSISLLSGAQQNCEGINSLSIGEYPRA